MRRWELPSVQRQVLRLRKPRASPIPSKLLQLSSPQASCCQQLETFYERGPTASQETIQWNEKENWRRQQEATAWSQTSEQSREQSKTSRETKNAEKRTKRSEIAARKGPATAGGKWMWCMWCIYNISFVIHTVWLTTDSFSVSDFIRISRQCRARSWIVGLLEKDSFSQRQPENPKSVIRGRYSYPKKASHLNDTALRHSKMRLET